MDLRRGPFGGAVLLVVSCSRLQDIPRLLFFCTFFSRETRPILLMFDHFTFHVTSQAIPLRASNLLQSELKKIVFLGNKEYMAREVGVM